MEGMLPASSLLSRPASTIYNTISDLRGGGIPWFRPHLCGKIDINFKKAKYRKTNSVCWGLLIQHLVFSVVPSGLPPVGGSSCHRQAWYMWPHGNCPHIQIQSFRDKRDENTCLENWKKDAQKKYNAETCWKATRNSRQVRRIPHLSSLLERVPLLCMVDHIELCIGDHPLVRISNQQNISLKIYDIIQPEKKQDLRVGRNWDNGCSFATGPSISPQSGMKSHVPATSLPCTPRWRNSPWGPTRKATDRSLHNITFR